MSTTLPLYWNLSSGSPEERLDASVKLIDALQRFQADYVVEGESSSLPKEEFERLHAPDVRYAVSRLVKGLGSSRESSRLGFAVALTELLSRLDNVSCTHAIALILETSQTYASMSKQEQRELHLGRLFGLTAVIESSLLFRSAPPAVGPSNVSALPTLSDFETVVRHLFELGEKLDWLRESCWWSALLALEGLYSSAVDWRTSAARWLFDTVFRSTEEWSVEKLSFAFRMKSLDPEQPWEEVLKPTFKKTSLLSPSNLPTISRTFNSLSGEESEASKSGAVHENTELHFGWSVILDSYLGPSGGVQHAEGLDSRFLEFFRLAVDESLFAPSASGTRKAWGFQVFAKALPRVPAAQMPLMFTPNFLRTWMAHLSRKDRFLHKFALSLIEEITSVAAQNPSVGFALVAQLTGKHGNEQFDRVTKTKTVQSLINAMDADGLLQYVEFLIQEAYEPVKDEETTKEQTSGKRAWIIDQLHLLLRNGSIPKHRAWIGLVLEFLVVNGLFVIKKKSSKSSFKCLHTVPRPPFSDGSRTKCREKLFLSLSSLISERKAANGQHTSEKGTDSAVVDHWFQYAVGLVEKLANDTKHVRPVLDTRDETAAFRMHAMQVIQSIEQSDASSAERSFSCVLLLQYLLLRSYEQDNELDTLQVATGAVCKMFDLPNPSTQDVEEDVEPIDILLDILIGFLEAGTAHGRDITSAIFAGLTKDVLPSTVDFILEQLTTKDVDEEASETEEQGVNDDAGEDQDVESEAQSSDEIASNGGSEDDDEDEQGEDEDVDVDPLLRTRLAELLGGAASAMTGTDAEGDSDEDSGEEYMDDDAMLQLDGQLADVLRPQVTGKKGRQHAQLEAMHFKFRVTDLLDIFLKNEPSSPHIIRLLTPLLDLAMSTSASDKQLSDKVISVLNSRIGNAKEYPDDAVMEDVEQALREVHSLACRAGTPPVLSHCCFYLCKVLIRGASGINEAVVNVYRESLKDFTSRKASRLNAKFFTTFITRFPICAWAMRDLIIVSLSEGSSYKQRQQPAIVDSLLSQLSLTNHVLESSKRDVEAFFSSLCVSIHQILKSACKAEKFPSDQVKDLLKLALRAVRLSSKLLPSTDSRALWQLNSFREVQGQLEQNPKYQASPSLKNLSLEIERSLASSSHIDPSADVPTTNGSSATDGHAPSEDRGSSPQPQRTDGPVSKKDRSKLKRTLDEMADEMAHKKKKKRKSDEAR